MPRILEIHSLLKPEPTSTIDMPQPSSNTASCSLLSLPTEEDKNDKNFWKEAN